MTLFSLLAIPHIVEAIAAQLSRNDLKQCIMVSEAFHHAFLPARHSHHILRIPSPPGTPPEQLWPNITHYGNHVRDLQLTTDHAYRWMLDTERTLDFILRPLIQACHQLRSLDIPHPVLLYSRCFKDVMHNNASTMRRLKLTVACSYVKLTTSWMVENVAPCRHLTLLHICNRDLDFHVELDTLLEMGERLPCLVELKLECVALSTRSGVAQKQAENEAYHNDPYCDLCSIPLALSEEASMAQTLERFSGKALFPRLQTLFLGEWAGDRTLCHLGFFVQQCPQLKVLCTWVMPGFGTESVQQPVDHWLSVLKASCQELTKVTVAQMPEPSPTDINMFSDEDLRGCSKEELRTMVSEFPKNHPKMDSLTLKSFVIPKTVLDKLALGFESRLRTLRLTQSNLVSGEGLCTVLSYCSNLEELWVDMGYTGARHPHTAVVDSRELFPDVHPPPWVCRNLEVFVCPIGWPCTTRSSDSILWSAEYAALERRFYSQLSALTQLQVLVVDRHVVLDMNWMVPYDEESLGFLWSLQRGLDQLGTLSKLREVSFNGHLQHIMGEQELKWMQQHWTQLEQLCCSNMSEIQCWMESHWPQVACAWQSKGNKC